MAENSLAYVLHALRFKAETRKPSGLFFFFSNKIPIGNGKRLTKSAHFLPIREDYKTEKLAKIYVNEIVARHGVPCQSFQTGWSITAHLWQALQEALDAEVMTRADYGLADLDEIEIDENLRFVEEPLEIVERDVKKLKRRRIPLVKVRWNSRQGAEYTWEREDQFRIKYPHLFSEPVPSSNVAT
ncbi:hypothetical protein Tco_0410580 [Tanacetum coccineum]